MTSGQILTTHEVAALMNASPSAVLRWIDAGLLQAFRTPGGHRRIDSVVLVEFLRTHRMPVPRQLDATAPVRLLIIDDQPRFGTALGVLLQKVDARVEVEVAEGAVDGLLKVGLRRPDVILLDAYMPGMDGLEVCRRVKQSAETARTAVVAMSGRPTADLQEKFRAAGAAAFIAKPLTAAAVAAALQELGLLSVRRRQD